MLKLNVTTIEKNAASYYKNSKFKNKSSQPCEKPPLNFFPTTYQNNKACSYAKNPEYSRSLSQPSPYRYYYYQNPPFSRLTNHYRQSPNSNSLL